MSWKIVEPEECLRSLVDEALQRAQGGAQVLHCTLGVRAAANAFVLLGLIPERQADKVLSDYQGGLQQKGLGTSWGLTDGELPAHSGAEQVYEAVAEGPAALTDVPEAMAPAGVSFPATIAGLAADLLLEWVKLADGQWRISFRASASDPGGQPDRPSVVMREALAMLRLTDETGHRYRPRVENVTWERIPISRQEWRGELVADQNPDAPRPAWLRIASAEAGTTETIPLAPAGGQDGPQASRDAGLVTGTAASRWPSPAEGYLEALGQVGAVKVGWTDVEPAKTAEIVAIVADCLLAVGALAPDSGLLLAAPPAVPAGDAVPPRVPPADPASWQAALAARRASRAHLGAVATSAEAAHRVLLAELPLTHARVVVERVTQAAGGLVAVTLHGTPWVPAAPWPVIAPCFTVSAVDDNSNRHEGVLEGFSAGRNATGHGTFFFWPPLSQAARSLTITVATLWEAATAEIAVNQIPANQAGTP
ncbi:MAG TPA: hypothetical protein VMG38_09280 [Trebonia sp.]|nr:hypothetical protein [Trebonia sp.]